MKILLKQQPMVIQQAIVYQGTTCFSSKDGKQVVKLSWTSEADHLRRARDHGVEGVAKLLAHRHITSIAELRDGLTFPEPLRFRSASYDSSGFSKSKSQAALSRSMGNFQRSKISLSCVEKRKATDSGTRESKRS